MSKALILQHAPYASPGRIIPVFRDFGIPTEVRHLYRGDEVPSDLDELRVLVVLGGPMGVRDVGSSQHPFLAKEVALLKRMIEHDRPTFGIALGAQLLAHAAGANVYPNTVGEAKTPALEYGWGPVMFPFPGGTEPIVYGMSDGAPMFHWHADAFDLPKLAPPANWPANGPPPPTGNSLLSSTPRCRNAAFRFRTKLFGFLYHMEFTRGDIDALLSADGQTATSALGSDAVAKIKEQTAATYPRYERLGNRILENFVQFLKVHEVR